VFGFRGMEALLERGRLGATILIDFRVAQLDADLGLFGFELLDLARQRLQFLAAPAWAGADDFAAAGLAAVPIDAVRLATAIRASSLRQSV
jgi:hypothetical protein